MSLFGRPERSYHPKVRHFAVVDAILYPPKVSSERVVDDVGTDGNNRWNGSKVPYLWPQITLFFLPQITQIPLTYRCRVWRSYNLYNLRNLRLIKLQPSAFSPRSVLVRRVFFTFWRSSPCLPVVTVFSTFLI